MTIAIDIGRLIVETPGICGGRPRIEGSRISVRHVVGLLRGGQSPEEIAAEYPQLDLARIYAAIAYYHANRARLDADFATDADEEVRLEQEWLARRQMP
ncbi:MAG: DUF433 domain-containing protein [Planctomycetaceae bacterium]